MVQQLHEMLEGSPQVGATGSHLLEEWEETLQKSYRYQKCWLKSIRVEIAKELHRQKELTRSAYIRDRLKRLGEIREKWAVVDNKPQQTVTRYFGAK